MKLNLNFEFKQYHDKHSEISLKELSQELSSIENKLEKIKMIQESIILSFIFNYQWLTKKEKELKEDWLVLESFLMEMKKQNSNSIEKYYEFDYDLEA